ncbi:hypothetical protein FACS1894170_11880 [Planctomycetales bacterium]|nr:hypothetical protein FACS1894170_11880 [Planctomycetales bacterium]
MDSKVTRRAVIGTIVGGLVAAPFVIRHYRHQRAAALDNPYLAAWNKCLQKVEAAPKPVKSARQGTFSLAYQLREDIPPMKYWSLFGSFAGIEEQLPGNVLPIWFEEQCADVCCKAISEDGGRIGVMVASCVRSHLSIGEGNPSIQEAPQFALSFNQQGLDSVVVDGKSHKMPKFDLPMPVATFANSLVFFLPAIQDCRVGYRWTIPAGKLYEHGADCTVTGIENIGGKEVARICVECKQSEFGRNPLLDMVPDEPQFKPYIDQYSKLEFRFSLDGEVFVELDTGLVRFARVTSTQAGREIVNKQRCEMSSAYLVRVLADQT